MLFITFTAFADEQPKTYTLTESAQDLGVIVQSLAAQPYGQVAATISRLQQQVASQDAIKKPEPKEK